MSDAFEVLADIRRWACETLDAGDAGMLCGMLSEASRHVGGLEYENARLREFAARLVEYVDPASHQDSCGIECPAHARCRGKSTCAFPDWALEKARELGIEVDA